VMLAVSTSPGGMDITNSVLDQEAYSSTMNSIGDGDDSLNEVRWCTRICQDCSCVMPSVHS